MRRAIALATGMVLVGTMAASAIAQQNRDARDRRSEQQNNQAELQPVQLPDGFQMKDLKQLDNIRDELAKVVEYSLTREDFRKVVDQFAQHNRDQMKDYKNQDFKTLDGLIVQINKDWNQKYGHDFNIKRANNVFTDREMIVQGVVTNPQVAATNFPAPASREAQLASSKQQAREREGQAGQSEQVLSKELQDSKGVALIRFPGGQNLPSVTASTIEEGHGSWYLALPLGTTSQQVHTQLQNELTYIGRSVDQWPADETAAYRLVAHRVISALYNVNAPESGKPGQLR